MEEYLHSAPESTEDLVRRLQPSITRYAGFGFEEEGPLPLNLLDGVTSVLKGQVAALDLIAIDATADASTPQKRLLGQAIWGIVTSLHMLVEDLGAIRELAMKTLRKTNKPALVP